MKLFEELKWRGLIKDMTDETEIERLLNEESVTFYWGTDPSGDSLHIGHLSSLLLAKRLEIHGHHPILLVGGATGLIGDPKPSAERSMIDKDILEKNYCAIHKQISSLFGYEMVNNYDWSKEINFVDFLRDYGKYFSVNYMLDKDIIRRRLESGITYTEFSYMIMQALDFLYLFEFKNCILQVEGSDQWGNITAGVDLIKKKLGRTAYGFTMPLILDKDGNKFGKSEGNALYIDKNKTSSYKLYQYLINTDDSMVIHYLKVFTFLSKDDIDKLELSVKEEPHLRLAAKALAKEVITFLHGQEDYEDAVLMSEILFSGDIKGLNARQIEEVFESLDKLSISINANIVDILVETNICSSKREARELISGGGITINGDKIDDLELVITDSMFIDNTYLVIRKGKKNYYLLVNNK